MYIIGENIHIISEKVKEALANRDSEFFMDLALRQVEAGAKAVDINLGPRKKDWAEVFPWIIEAVEKVVDVPLSIDTTNVDGMEAALKQKWSETAGEISVTTSILGVDEAGSELLVRTLALPAGLGVTMAIIRKARVLTLSSVGLWWFATRAGTSR